MSRTTWNIDPTHSSVSFSVKHMMIAKVHGGFEKVSGQLVYDRENPAQSRIHAEIDAASISTREPKRDEHLKSADFFDVAKFPALTFVSKEIKVTGGGLEVVGELTIRGIAKTVSLEVEGPTGELKDPYGNFKIGASATTKIKRKDFGLTWNATLEAGGVLVGDDITITLEMQFARAAERVAV